MGKIDNLKEIIKTAIRKELEETNTTASGGDYATPNAFSKDKNSTTNRAVKDSEGIGFSKAKETHKNFVKLTESAAAEQAQKLFDLLSTGKPIFAFDKWYHELLSSTDISKENALKVVKAVADKKGQINANALKQFAAQELGKVIKEGTHSPSDAEYKIATTYAESKGMKLNGVGVNSDGSINVSMTKPGSNSDYITTIDKNGKELREPKEVKEDARRPASAIKEVSNTNKSADYEEIKVGGSKDLGNGYKAKKESESDEGSTWCMYKDGKEIGKFDYDQDADAFWIDGDKSATGHESWENVLDYYKKSKNEAAVVYNPTGAASAARYSKVSPQQYSQVVAKALSKRNDRTATFQKAKYIMHNGQPHKMENGKLIPLTKVDHSKDPLYNAIASGKQIKKEGSRPMKAISSEYKALAKKDGLINAANEFVANFGDTTAEELSRIFGIDISKAKKIIAALEVNESLNEGAKELEFFTFLKNEIKQHHGSEVGPALARVKDKFIQLYSGATMEELNEISYKEYKNDPALTSKQKLNIAIKECNRALFEIGRYLKQNKKLREEEGLELSEYWKSTAVKIVQMDERLLNLRREIRNFGLKEIVAKLAAEAKEAKKNKSSMKKDLGETNKTNIKEANATNWTKQQLDKELKDLRQGAKEAGDIDDSMAWDIADSWIDDNQGVEKAIKKWYPNVSDFKGFVANHIA